ncbi:MAG: L,D-transpeptidase family protein [Candidatus Gribaldobacteria bacterium]|nr:L,D-transpeptidase family protein [Candidatus Gribaldobacteria bacterium]
MLLKTKIILGVVSFVVLTTAFLGLAFGIFNNQFQSAPANLSENLISQPVEAKAKDVVAISSKNEVLLANSTSTQEPQQDQRILPDWNKIKQGLLNTGVDFLEADLQQMNFWFYEKGQVVWGAPILKRGDVPDWGGTPLGLYQIESKRAKVYSLAAYTWMPFAMKFLGKYFIHGIPYDNNGVKVPVSGYSGGCITLDDQTIKFVFDKAEVKMPILVLDNLNDNYQYPLSKVDVPRISASKYLVADINSGTVLLEKESQTTFPIHKLSNLMEATIVIENNNLNQNILITKDMVADQNEKSVARLGNNMSVVSLLYPLLVESSANASQALGSLWGKISTVNLMNEKAKIIMMPQTKFVDIAGVSLENVSTPQDLFYLIRYVSQTRPALLKISKSMWVRTFGPRPFDFSELTQQNNFSSQANFVGGKTTKDEAGESGMFVFNFKLSNNTTRRVAVIIAQSNDLKTDLDALYQWTKNNFFN